MMMARKMLMMMMRRRRKRRMVRDAQHLAVRCKSGGGEFPAHIATLPLILKTFILKRQSLVSLPSTSTLS